MNIYEAINDMLIKKVKIKPEFADATLNWFIFYNGVDNESKYLLTNDAEYYVDIIETTTDIAEMVPNLVENSSHKSDEVWPSQVIYYGYISIDNKLIISSNGNTIFSYKYEYDKTIINKYELKINLIGDKKLERVINTNDPNMNFLTYHLLKKGYVDINLNRTDAQRMKFLGHCIGFKYRYEVDNTKQDLIIDLKIELYGGDIYNKHNYAVSITNRYKTAIFDIVLTNKSINDDETTLNVYSKKENIPKGASVVLSLE